MSRFGPVDPFYVAMRQAELEDLMRRVLAIDVRYVMCGGHQNAGIAQPIVDRDPGDEDQAHADCNLSQKGRP